MLQHLLGVPEQSFRNTVVEYASSSGLDYKCRMMAEFEGVIEPMQVFVVRIAVIETLVIDFAFAVVLRLAASAIGYVETVLLPSAAFSKLLGVLGIILVWASNTTIVLGLLIACAKTLSFFRLTNREVVSNSNFASAPRDRPRRGIRSHLNKVWTSPWVRTESLAVLFTAFALAISYLLFREALHQAGGTFSQFAYFVASFCLMVEICMLGTIAVRKYLHTEVTEI